jgi:hypothetical protein
VGKANLHYSVAGTFETTSRKDEDARVTETKIKINAKRKRKTRCTQ